MERRRGRKIMDQGKDGEGEKGQRGRRRKWGSRA